jgi:hypothetical protein
MGILVIAPKDARRFRDDDAGCASPRVVDRLTLMR